NLGLRWRRNLVHVHSAVITRSASVRKGDARFLQDSKRIAALEHTFAQPVVEAHPAVENRLAKMHVVDLKIRLLSQSSQRDIVRAHRAAGAGAKQHHQYPARGDRSLLAVGP